MVTRKRVFGVVVLGDVGRSPRMQYHALSLSSIEDSEVHIIGTAGERCIPAIETSKNIIVHTMLPIWRNAPRSLFLLYAPFKVVYQVHLNYTLFVLF
jgi:beta-1,4-mannosyltransferase